jgi:hypothetical protein
VATKKNNRRLRAAGKAPRESVDALLELFEREGAAGVLDDPFVTAPADVVRSACAKIAALHASLWAPRGLDPPVVRAFYIVTFYMRGAHLRRQAGLPSRTSRAAELRAHLAAVDPWFTELDEQLVEELLRASRPDAKGRSVVSAMGLFSKLCIAVGAFGYKLGMSSAKDKDKAEIRKLEARIARTVSDAGLTPRRSTTKKSTRPT